MDKKSLRDIKKNLSKLVADLEAENNVETEAMKNAAEVNSEYYSSKYYKPTAATAINMDRK